MRFGRLDTRRGTADSALKLPHDAATKEVFMTRFRFVSLSLVALLCFGLTLPALAHAPYVVPSGLIDTLNSMVDNVLTWFGG